MRDKEIGIVGYLDDDNDYKDLQENLEEYVQLLPVEDCHTLEDIQKWIIKNRIECFIVDHKLVNKYSFVGTDVIAFLNKKLPDLPCVIITTYKDDSISENLVMELLIKDRDELPGDDLKYTEFGNILIQACKTFRKRLEQRQKEFQELYEKKKSSNINTDEEDTMRLSYNLLKEYGEIDDIPSEMLTSEMSKKIDHLIDSLKKINDRKC